jgi:TrmH family RNA methyltransferase
VKKTQADCAPLSAVIPGIRRLQSVAWVFEFRIPGPECRITNYDVLVLESAELDRLVIVMVGARNPLNIGASARAISNLGFSRLRVVLPYDVAFRQARSAVGASEVMRTAEEHPGVSSAVADCGLVVGTTGARRRDLDLPLYRLEQAGRAIRAQLAKGRVALLFGSEKTGLSNEDLSHCHWLLRIPTREQHPSMNLGQSVAICLYELVRHTRAGTIHDKAEHTAPILEIDRLTEVLLDALRSSGYVKERTATSTEQKVRRLVRRLSLNPEDAVLLTGMLRQVLWKLNSGQE